MVFIGFAIGSLFIDPYEENHLVPDVDVRFNTTWFFWWWNFIISGWWPQLYNIQTKRYRIRLNNRAKRVTEISKKNSFYSRQFSKVLYYIYIMFASIYKIDNHQNNLSFSWKSGTFYIKFVLLFLFSKYFHGGVKIPSWREIRMVQVLLLKLWDYYVQTCLLIEMNKYRTMNPLV